jgi:hypothetical protein
LTAIAAIITSHFTAHATDSFITERMDDGTYKIRESQETKIVRVPAWRGAIAYWGRATHDSDWSTLQWLRERAANAREYPSAEVFARTLARDLTIALRSRRFQSPVQGGIGMHFSSYEWVEGYWIPELFHIPNWENESYSAVQQEIVVTRETYGGSQDITDRSEADGDPARRLVVHRALQDGLMLVFNNGDPLLFNPIANSIFSAMHEIGRRGHLRNPSDAQTHLALVRRPIEIVSNLLSDFAEKDMRVIGGKPHDLAIAPTGNVESTTGDAS